MIDILPHLKGGPVLACFGLSDTPKLRSAIAAVVKKYPNITLACFDSECYQSLRDVEGAVIGYYPRMQDHVMEKYNVIGALVGDYTDVSRYGLKEMRI